jgi:hypothetical protein
MRRGTGSSEKDRLDAILKRKAEEGVSIYIMLWNEPPSLMDNMCALPLPRAPLHAAGPCLSLLACEAAAARSGTNEQILRALHPSIKVCQSLPTTRLALARRSVPPPVSCCSDHAAPSRVVATTLRRLVL